MANLYKKNRFSTIATEKRTKKQMGGTVVKAKGVAAKAKGYKTTLFIIVSNRYQ